jgi:hypothetical protein
MRPTNRTRTVVAIRRQPGPPRVVVPLIAGTETLYEVDLTATPSRVWRAAFLRPPARLTGARSTPARGRIGLEGSTILFRTAPARLPVWLRRIDRWIAYANSVVQE